MFAAVFPLTFVPLHSSGFAYSKARGAEYRQENSYPLLSNKPKASAVIF